MSRAFVKENDLEHAGIDIPERSISDEINYVTPNGLKSLQETVTKLESDRAKLLGDDNPAPKEKKMRIEREIRYYLSRIDSAIIIYPDQQPTDIVLFSANVEVENFDGKILTFMIVGEDEANIKLSKISYVSPLAKALIGAKIDDEVIWHKPSGNEQLIITGITYPNI
ncbi:MAG: GreA/GreB family elongation factor [Methylophilaceae bacterium]|jgi:transcription elongation GreA/GreB family factor|nr:GreA/GreB family elongation factor [Methylophilaceae bacterium]